MKTEAKGVRLNFFGNRRAASEIEPGPFIFFVATVQPRTNWDQNNFIASLKSYTDPIYFSRRADQQG
jgi:hypothetical protein